jgi:hypothetical protein
MISIATSEDLKKAIKQLELQQANEWPLLKEEFLKTAERLKLINIIKNTFKEAVNVPDLKTDIINTAIGLTTGILAKKIIIGKTLNPLSKLAGVVLEIFVANKTTKNANDIKSMGSIIMNKLFNRSTVLESHDGKSV